MSSPPLSAGKRAEQPLDVIPVLGPWVRGALLGVAAGLVLVFSVALWLDPYRPDGTARRMETHRQLNLPPCAFKVSTGLPCPSCGMTTSFALLMHGDVVNSLKANAVGTLLAAFGLLLIPWSVVSAVCRRPLFLRSLEWACVVVILTFLGLLLLRWVIVVLVIWWTGTPLES
jgi:hypothetical protein